MAITLPERINDYVYIQTTDLGKTLIVFEPINFEGFSYIGHIENLNSSKQSTLVLPEIDKLTLSLMGKFKSFDSDKIHIVYPVAGKYNEYCLEMYAETFKNAGIKEVEILTGPEMNMFVHKPVVNTKKMISIENKKQCQHAKKLDQFTIKGVDFKLNRELVYKQSDKKIDNLVIGYFEKVDSEENLDK